MSLLSLDIRDFRNIQHSSLSFSPGLNLVSGANAAGKTSLLEAIYCLGRVRSFRTAIAVEPVRYGNSAYRLVGRIRQRSGRIVNVGVERRVTAIRVQLDGRSISRLSDLAGSFPVQVMSADTDSILDGGPACRRQTIDWALFHVEHPYREYWQRYARALRQRNAALRNSLGIEQVRAWDSELASTGRQIDNLRQYYFEALDPGLRAMLRDLLPGKEMGLTYHRGWPRGLDLSEALFKSLERDRALGYTQYGVHRGDFTILLDERDTRLHCSRGQKKALIVGFMLAQIALQRARDIEQGAFLLDDFTSELDDQNQVRVLTALRQLDVQVFVTAIEGIHASHDWAYAKRFHVEHGAIQEVV